MTRGFTISFLVLAGVLVPSAHEVAMAVPAARYGSVPIESGGPGVRLAPGARFAAAAAAEQLPWRANMIGVSWTSPDRSGHGVTVTARVLDGQGWSEWFVLELNEDEGANLGTEPGESRRVFTMPRWVGTVSDVDVRVRTDAHAANIRDVRLELVNTLGDAEPKPIIARAARAIGRFLTARRTEPADAMTRQPRIFTRAEWGADESWVNDPPGHASRLDLAIVHHTAGSNSYSRSEAPAVIRGVYSYHVHGRGYSDIAYNFLVDRFGRTYEGRAGGIASAQIGAHAGGFNDYSTGVALLGTFTSHAPSKAMTDALVNLLAWKLDVHHVPPIGSFIMEAQRTASRYQKGERVRLNRISAHRHTNATTCPGGETMERFGSIRKRVDAIGHPKIYLPKLSATAIRPSADGIDATVAVKATFSRTVDWTWRVLDAGGSTWFRMTGSGERMNRVWNGVGLGGVLLPPGRYTWRLDAVRPSTGRVARKATGRIDVLGPMPRGCGGCFVSTPAADFNGDGRSDLAVGVAGADVSGQIDAGAVNVLYGSADGGLTAAGDDRLTAEALGIEFLAGDGFGASLAAGDFDGDRFDDLAIGIPRADVAGRANAGAVAIVPGSSTGLNLQAPALWTQDSPGVGGTAEAGDGFGASLAAGDLNGDERADLAVGSPSEDAGGMRDVGIVTVLLGGSTGLTPTALTWWQNAQGVPGTAAAWDAFGSALAIGDVNGDARGDLVVGVPGDTVGAAPRAGSLQVLFGSAAGPTTTGAASWDQSGLGSTDTPETGDKLGFALASADINDDGFDEVLVGAPGEELGSVTDAGAVVALFGSSEGLSQTGEQILHRGLVDLGGSEGVGDGFGSSLTMGDFDNDGHFDLVVGVPGDDVPAGETVIDDAGSITVVRGSDTGLLALGGEGWDLTTTGVQGTPARGDLFGWALATGDFDGDGFADLVAGIPGMNLPKVANAGGVLVLYGSAGGISTRDQRWHQNISGVRGVARPNDLFGSV